MGRYRTEERMLPVQIEQCENAACSNEVDPHGDANLYHEWLTAQVDYRYVRSAPSVNVCSWKCLAVWALKMANAGSDERQRAGWLR
jgi:hypothetical protein